MGLCKKQAAIESIFLREHGHAGWPLSPLGTIGAAAARRAEVVAVAPEVEVTEQLPPTGRTISVAEVRQILRAGLPLPVWDLAAAVAWVGYQQRHKETAYRPARSGTIQTLEQARAPNFSW